MIDKILHELLLENEVVVMPNFGAFVFHELGAKVNVKTGRFNPGCRVLRFQSQLKHQDGMLIGAISQKKKCSFGEATQLFEGWLQELKSNIDRNGSSFIPQVGTLKRENGVLSFTPSHENWESHSAYGLYPFFVEPISQLNKVAELEPKATGSALVKPMVSSSAKYWRAAAAVAIPLTIAAFSFSYPNNGLEASFSWFGPTETAYAERTAVKVDTSNKAFEWNDVVGQGNDARYFSYEVFPEFSVEVENENAQPDPGYYLIQGCFRSLENAEKQVLKLKEKGYSNAQIVDYYKGLYRVSIDQSASKVQARKQLKKFNQRFKGLWIAKLV